MKPPSSIRHPMTSSVSGKNRERDPRMRGPAGLPLRAAPREHDRGGAIAERCRRDDVRDRAIAELQGQRAELDGEKNRDLVGKPAEIVGGASRASRAANAAEAEERRALDVGAHTKPIDELHVDGRRGDAGHGGEEEMIDVGRFEAGAPKRDSSASPPSSVATRPTHRWPRRTSGGSGTRPWAAPDSDRGRSRLDESFRPEHARDRTRPTRRAALERGPPTDSGAKAARDRWRGSRRARSTPTMTMGSSATQ